MACKVTSLSLVGWVGMREGERKKERRRRELKWDFPPNCALVDNSITAFDWLRSSVLHRQKHK